VALILDNLLFREGAFTLRAHWQLEAQARVALIGPSGAGKSTLLALIGGFLQPHSGRLLWRGADITATTPSQRPVATLFQEGNLFPHLTAYENAALAVNTRLKLSAVEKRRVLEALERVGLAGFEARKPAQLSGGQASRAALARALCQDKPLLLLDEPFAALGPAMRGEMLDLLTEIASEHRRAVLMVSHDPSDALRFAQAVSLVAQGVAAPPEETKALFAKPPAALSAYLGHD
jgi:thiamine transport system ATP-binding protein